MLRVKDSSVPRTSTLEHQIHKLDDLFPGLRAAWFVLSGREPRKRRSAQAASAQAASMIAAQSVDIAVLSVAQSDLDLVDRNMWSPWCRVLTKAPRYVSSVDTGVCVRTLEQADLKTVVPLLASSMKAGLPADIVQRYSETRLIELSLARIERVLGGDSLALVSHSGDKISGFTFASNEGQFLHVHDVVVSRDMAGAGIGLVLEQYVEAFAYLRNVPEMRGTVSFSDLNNFEEVSTALVQRGWRSLQLKFTSSGRRRFKRP